MTIECIKISGRGQIKKTFLRVKKYFQNEACYGNVCDHATLCVADLIKYTFVDFNLKVGAAEGWVLGVVTTVDVQQCDRVSINRYLVLIFIMQRGWQLLLISDNC